MQINFMFKTLHCIIYYLLFIQLYLIWLNVAVTSHLCKISAATIQGQRLLQCNNDCRGLVLFKDLVIYYSVPSYVGTSFLSKPSSLMIEFRIA